MIKRRDKILKVYLPAVNPIVSARMDAQGRLTFDNAAVSADVAKRPKSYRAAWFEFDNATGDTRPLGETSSPIPPWRRLTVCPRRTAATSGWTSRRTGRHTRPGAGLFAPTSDARAPAGSWSGWSARRKCVISFASRAVIIDPDRRSFRELAGTISGTIEAP